MKTEQKLSDAELRQLARHLAFELIRVVDWFDQFQKWQREGFDAAMLMQNVDLSDAKAAIAKARNVNP